MISRFFDWLGRVFSAFITWLGNLFWLLFTALLDGIQEFFDYLLGLIQSMAESIYTYVLSLLPENESITQGVSVLRSCWVVADEFVPLSEGFVLILTFLGFYVTIKVIGFVIRIALAVTP